MAESAGFTIVRMSGGHIPRLAQIERLCFAQPWSERSLREELDNPAAVYFVAERRGRAEGYAGMRAAGGVGYLDNVAVAPGCRRQGAATQLLRALAAYARQAGLGELTLEVRRSNAGAVALYRREGFEPAGVRPGFYERPREDALIMTRSRAPAPSGQTGGEADPEPGRLERRKPYESV